MPLAIRRHFLVAGTAALLAVQASVSPAANPPATKPAPAKPSATKPPPAKPKTAKSTSPKPSTARPSTVKPGAGESASVKPSAAALAADPFDGKSLTGWTTVDGKPAGDGWEVVDGVIHRKPGGKAGNIVTAREFGDFDLSFEWKIAAKGNSGLKYRVRSYGGSWLGLEYQIYDDGAVKKVRTRGSAGAIYDLYEPNDAKALKPVGEYNTARIVVKDGRIEHWLNGKLIAQATVGDKEWKKRMAESKFAEREDFALNERGRIMLTDHGSEVWYRNFRLEAEKK
jgi:hypothetical protein